MVAPNPLSEQDLAEARTELSVGKPLTVWFTSAAVGVPANGSAKVISIDDVAEGDFIQVRPAGTRDTMFCSPNELTRTRPTRKRVQHSAEQAPERIVPPQARRAVRSRPRSRRARRSRPRTRRRRVRNVHVPWAAVRPPAQPR